LTESLHEYSFIIDESKIHIKCDNKKAINAAAEEIRRHREQLVKFIEKHPDFSFKLRPVANYARAPRIVRLMIASSKAANVGPMASVAGALADIGLEAMLREKERVAIVEDGGEIAVFTQRPIVISIFSGNMALSSKIGFLLEKKDCPVGVATSSSKTGHALSFGEADSVTVVANNASLADAAATAICNSVIGENVKESIRRGLERARTIKGVRGVLIIREESSGLWGNLPRIVKVN